MIRRRKSDKTQDKKYFIRLRRGNGQMQNHQRGQPYRSVQYVLGKGRGHPAQRGSGRN